MFPAIRGLTAVERAPGANLRLGSTLAAVAGAVNAGAFLLVGQYTSHMTGVVSSLADHAALGEGRLALVAGASLSAFALGAATTAILVNWGLRSGLRGTYCLPLALESALLLAFGALGTTIASAQGVFAPAAVLLLCYLMGLQNAVISKISKSEIRTTHVTGLVTDAGIELGKALFVNRDPAAPKVRSDRAKLKVQLYLIACFFGGGVVGAWGFKSAGWAATIPLALPIAVLAARPIAEDLALARQSWLRGRRGR